MKRIHKPARPAADDAARHSGFMKSLGFVRLSAAIEGSYREKCRRDDAARGENARGTLIHNGNCSQPLAIRSLAVSLIKSSFGRVSMTTVGCSTLLSTSFAAAIVAAVLLTMVAPAADPEKGIAFAPTANPLAQNIFSGLSHLHPKARLDKWPPIMSA